MSNLGLLSAGDSFSGSLISDTNAPNACPRNIAYSLCIDLSSLTLNLPPSSGLSVTSLPDSKLNFGGALYVGTPPVLLNFQVNDRSSIDSQYYIFGFYPDSSDAFGGAYVGDVNFTHYLRTINYISSGPAAVPEPATLFLLGIAALAGFALRRRRQ